uniref:Uncharacterized protein n=1 Tax=Timema poppense TaxID=170557 RepID=A0A7R9H018_TIMPO|nr:unnamed protein product [Timema poppensis]
MGARPMQPTDTVVTKSTRAAWDMQLFVHMDSVNRFIYGGKVSYSGYIGGFCVALVSFILFYLGFKRMILNLPWSSSNQTVAPDNLHIPFPPRKELPRLDVGVVPCRIDSWRSQQEEALCNDFYGFLEVDPDSGEGRGGESPLPHREDVPLEGMKLPYRSSGDTTTTNYEFLREDGVKSLYTRGLLCSCGDRSKVQTPRNTRSGRVYGYC